MLNLKNVNTFLDTFAQRDYKAASTVLRLKFNTASTVKSYSADLAKQGYLGYLAFSRDEKNDIALQLLPNVALENSTVVANSQDITEGVSIGSSMKYFVIGRIAHRNLLASYQDEVVKSADELTDLAKYFGGESSFLNVLSSMAEITSVEKHLFPSKVWEKADAADPLCQTLAAAWSKSEKELGDWANEAIKIYPEVNIVRRLLITHNYVTRSEFDLTETISKVFLGDDVIDPGYNSLFRTPNLGGWSIGAVVVGVKWLLRKELAPPVDPNLWEALKQYANDPKKYNGEPHFEVAKSHAESDPVVAYTLTANAAGYYARAKRKAPTQMIKFARDLASKNGWTDLAEVLSWAV